MARTLLTALADDLRVLARRVGWRPDGVLMTTVRSARGQSSRLIFPPFQLDPHNEQLWHGQELVKLQPKTFAVLQYFAERPRRLVTKRQLLDACWANVHVGDSAVKTLLKDIRRALRDDASAPRFIETVHRRGYRFLAHVEQEATPVAAELSPTIAARADGCVMRGDELRTLEEALESALSGNQQVVLVSGETGVGKTTLVNAFLAPLRRAANLSVAWGQCSRQHGAGEAYLPFLEALGRLAREGESAHVQEALRRYAPSWLVQVGGLEPAAGSAEAAGLSQRLGSEQMLRQLADALPVITRIRPLLVVIEDLHWADPATINLIAYLARRSDPAQLMLACTLRPAELSPSSGAAITQLMIHRRCKNLRLGCLGEHAVRHYIGARLDAHRLPSGLAKRLTLYTGGNPLLLAKTIDDWIARGLLQQTGGAWTLTVPECALTRSAPESVVDLVEGELQTLSALELEVLEAASVVDGFSPAPLASAIGHDTLEVEAICVGWARQGRFFKSNAVSSPDPSAMSSTAFTFIHPLRSQILYARLGPLRQAALRREMAVARGETVTG